MEYGTDQIISRRVNSGFRTIVKSGERRGFTLVIALCFLAIIMVLLLAFFTSIDREHATTKIYSGGVNAQLLSDTAVNLVMGQIAAATQGIQPGITGRSTWASQPGMIRTFSDQDQNTQVADNCYKLYSSSSMVISGTQTLQVSGQDVPSDWNTHPALYTDLNAPVVDATGTYTNPTGTYTNPNAPIITVPLKFPILDGNGLVRMNVNGSSVLTYDTNNDGTPDVEGFSIPVSSVPTYDSTKPVTATNNPVSMPVQWLYMLKDGTIVAPNSASGNSVTWTGTLTPTSSNPIVGRVAFWADDETCKLNINTASEGTYYGPSYSISPTDMASVASPVKTTYNQYGLFFSPPATGEYNRYLGHPASTCLSVALGTWLGNLTTGTSAPVTPTAYTTGTSNTTYLTSITPYLQFPGVSAPGLATQTSYLYKGSQAGTVYMVDAQYAATGTTNPTRLFSSIDELVFDPSRSAVPGLSKNIVSKMKFFLTASSRAPELTPFNTPKVSIWPQWMALNDRNTAAANMPIDNLDYLYPIMAANVMYSRVLAVCSEFGTNASSPSHKNEYFFQRFAPSTIKGSATGATVTAIGSWADTYRDWDNVSRNPRLANYLCTMGTLAIPGYGKAFISDDSDAKYKYTPRNFSQIVLETLDYIRSNVDRIGYLTDDGNIQDLPGFDNSSFNSDVGGAGGGSTNSRSWQNYITPLMVTGTAELLPGMTDQNDVLKGFGCYPIVTEIGLIQTGTTTSYQRTVLGAQVNLPVDPTPGPVLDLNVSVNTNMPLVTGTGSPLVANQQPWAMQLLWKFGFYGELNRGNERCMSRFFSSWGGAGKQVTGMSAQVVQNMYVNWPYFPVQTGTLGPTITMGSGTLTMNLWPKPVYTPITLPPAPPGRAGPEYVQSITVKFPTVSSIPMPTTPLSMRAPPNLNNADTPTATTEMAVRSVIFSATSIYKGDWRLLGALPKISDPDNKVFVTAPGYDSANPQAHSFRMRGFNDVPNARYQPYSLTTIPTGTTANTSVAGSLIQALKNTDYNDGNAPNVPVGLTGAINSLGYPGDWDTGPGQNPDGPYINTTMQWPPGISGYQTFDVLSQFVGAAFSPNSQIPSPVQFGSLPTGVYPQKWSADDPKAEPWQTLLFCPNPAARVDVPATTLAKDLPDAAGAEHRGFINPPDHLYLEFYTMPVVQPYAISEPFSTAGKVNLNCQIMPFTNIERSTAVRGVLKNLIVTAISGQDLKSPAGSGGTHPTPATEISYKFNNATVKIGSLISPKPSPNEIHYNVDRDATIAGWEQLYFQNGYIFRYPSEICDLFLVPKRISGATYLGSTPPTKYNDLVSWWSSKTDLNAMIGTGDNAREDPYNHLYPRLTTKSNSYTVHYRVQMLKKAPGSDPKTWTEGQDVVVSESRGSTLIERYLDPNDPSLTANWDAATMKLDFADSTVHVDLSALYKFRVISTKTFSP